MSAVLSGPATGRSPIPENLFDRLSTRIVADHDLDRGYAERVLDQALVFLVAAARHSGAPLVPSRAVDMGWHAFLLHTREYAEFCDRLAGRFIHHVPDDSPDGDGAASVPGEARARTLAAIEVIGYRVDPHLWPLADSKCHDCTAEGCSASGKDGNENTDSQGGRSLVRGVMRSG